MVLSPVMWSLNHGFISSDLMWSLNYGFISSDVEFKPWFYFQ